MNDFPTEVLVAEDDANSRHLLERNLREWGFKVVAVGNGEEALRILNSDSAPSLALLDWTMPGMDGITVCSRVREQTGRPYTYLILLTARERHELPTALRAGADDFVMKPYDLHELRARLGVGQRLISLDRALLNQATHLEDVLAKASALKDLLPICCYCKGIRDDENYWHNVEDYIHAQRGTPYSYSVCPSCLEKLRHSLKMGAA